MLVEHRGWRPQLAPTAYVAPNAVVCGDVIVGEDCRILFGAVMAAEGGRVELGDKVIVMEQAVVRGRQGHPTRIGATSSTRCAGRAPQGWQVEWAGRPVRRSPVHPIMSALAISGMSKWPAPR